MDANEVAVKFSMNPDESVQQTQRILQNVAQSLDNIGKRSQAVSAQMASVGESLQQNAVLMSRRVRAGFLFMAAGPLMNFVKRAFTVTESIYDMSQATGMSTKQINQMQGAFALAGIEVARTNNLIMALNSSMLRAQLRIKYMGKIPRELMPIQGLLPSITNGASLDKTLFALSDRLSQLSRREARGVLMGLGITDARVQDMLTHGRRVLQEYLERGKKLAVINDRLVEDSWRLRKAWVSTSYSIRMSAMETFGDVAPVLGSLGEIISNVAQHIKAFKPFLFVGAVTALSTIGYWAKTGLSKVTKTPSTLFGGAIAGALALGDLSEWSHGRSSALPNVWETLFGSPEKFRSEVNSGIGMLKEVTGGAGELFDSVQDLWKTMGLGNELAPSAMLGWLTNGPKGAVQFGSTGLALERQKYLKRLEERQANGETLSVKEQTILNTSNALETASKSLASIFAPYAKTGFLTPAVGEFVGQIAETLAINRAEKTGKPVSFDKISEFANGTMGKTLLLGAHFASLLGGDVGMGIGLIVTIVMILSAIWGVISDWWAEHVPSYGEAFKKIDGKMVETFNQWRNTMVAQVGGEFDRLSPKEKAQSYLGHLRALGLNDEQARDMIQSAIDDPDTGDILRNVFTEAISGLNAAKVLNPSGDAATQKLAEGVVGATGTLGDINRTLSSMAHEQKAANEAAAANMAINSGQYGSFTPWITGMGWGVVNSDGSGKQ